MIVAALRFRTRTNDEGWPRMRYRAIAAATGAALVVSLAALAQGQQAPGGGNPGGNPQQKPAPPAALQASVETANLALVFPDRYAVPVVLEPNRKVFLVAANDGILKSISAPVGTPVREAAEIAQLDRAEATAKARIATANVKEAKAEVEKAKVGTADAGIAAARLDAAEARAELAQLDLDRCTLRAPFPGKILAVPVSPGQYLSKGNLLAELADNAILKVLVPVDRTQVKTGQEIELFVEGKPVKGRVMALVPLPEPYVVLRELATPWAAAWVNVNNSDGVLEPGQRVRGPFAPMQPITAVPTRALRQTEGGDGVVQVLRFSNVLDIPVRTIGDAGFERTQVSGAFIATDAVIVESSLPMAAGTVIRFTSDPPVSGAAGANSGMVVDVMPPAGAAPMRVGAGAGGNRVAPIGSPDANVPAKGAGRPSGTGKAAAKGGAGKAAPKAGGGGGTPF